MQDFARSAVADDRATMVSTHAASASADASTSVASLFSPHAISEATWARLDVEQVWEVHGEARLRDAEHEAVGEAVDAQAVIGADAVAPLVGERHPVASDDVEADAPRVVGADLEAGREDQAVDGVFGAVDDDAVGGDPLDAHALGVDEA